MYCTVASGVSVIAISTMAKYGLHCCSSLRGGFNAAALQFVDILKQAGRACFQCYIVAGFQLITCRTPEMCRAVLEAWATLPMIWPAASLCCCRGCPSSEGRQHQYVLLELLPPAAVPLLIPLHLLHSADLARRSRCCQGLMPSGCRLAPHGQPPGLLADPCCCCPPPQYRQQWQPLPPLPPPLRCAAAALLPPVGSTYWCPHMSVWLTRRAPDWVESAMLKHDNVGCMSAAFLVQHVVQLHVSNLHLRALGWGIQRFQPPSQGI